MEVKKMSNKFLSLFQILIVFSLVTYPAFAMEPFRGGRPSPEMMIDRMARDIGLSKQQKESFLAGAKKIEEVAYKLMEKDRTTFGKIERELLKDSPDKKAIYNYMFQINQNRTQTEFKRMEQMIELRKKLTPEQRAKLQKIFTMQKERGDMGPGGPGWEKRP
jgi:Spy/CpxP family protein refolding chaperone